MSSPYIQVELDALKKAPLLASVLGIQLREAIGGLTMMWAHAYSHKADEVSGLYIRAFFGVDAGPALAEMGFVEHVSDATWRVRGAGRYRRLNEVRSEAGRKGGQASAQAKAASKQAIAQANGQANEAKQNQATAEASAKQNPQASKQLLKQNHDSAKQNQALEPITEGNPLRDYPSGHEASAPEPSAVDALTQPPAGAGGGGAESSDPACRRPGEPDPALWRPLPTPPTPTPAQARCMAMRWSGDRTPEHATALMAWSRECGVPETRLRKWLAEREQPLYFEPSVPPSKRREAENARQFPPSVTQ